MKILFMCGSLEPGRDGVGDYTCKLAGQLIKNGHKTAIIALNDRHITASLETILNSGNANIPSLRLASRETDKIKIKKAKLWVNKTNPDWISLQYVPYSFHKKGLPWKLSRSLLMIGRDVKWHIMFHELWVGMEKGAPYKNILLGTIQKFLIKNMIKSIAPKCIHTQAPVYQAQLEGIGYKAKLLPLFCNLNTKKKSAKKRDNRIHIAVFGTIQKNADLKDFIQWLLQNDHYLFHFHFIGGNGPEQDHWINQLSRNKIPITIHGWLRNGEVSEALGLCQWGLTSTSYYLTKKSGSVAAMLAHDLIVFCIAGEWIPRNIDIDSLSNEYIINWDNRLKIENITFSKNHNSLMDLNNITKNFIENLNTC